MSLQDVKKFLDMAKSDKNIANKLLEIGGKIQQKDVAFDEEKIIKDKIIPIAQQLGINFTAEEFLQYAMTQMAELSDDDLLNISGGASRKSVALGFLFATLSSFINAATINSRPLVTPIAIEAKQEKESSGQKAPNPKNTPLNKEYIQKNIDKIISNGPEAKREDMRNIFNQSQSNAFDLQRNENIISDDHEFDPEFIDEELRRNQDSGADINELNSRQENSANGLVDSEKPLQNDLPNNEGATNTVEAQQPSGESAATNSEQIQNQNNERTSPAQGTSSNNLTPGETLVQNNLSNNESTTNSAETQQPSGGEGVTNTVENTQPSNPETVTTPEKTKNQNEEGTPPEQGDQSSNLTSGQTSGQNNNGTTNTPENTQPSNPETVTTPPEKTKDQNNSENKNTNNDKPHTDTPGGKEVLTTPKEKDNDVDKNASPRWKNILKYAGIAAVALTAGYYVYTGGAQLLPESASAVLSSMKNLGGNLQKSAAPLANNALQSTVNVAKSLKNVFTPQGGTSFLTTALSFLSLKGGGKGALNDTYSGDDDNIYFDELSNYINSSNYSFNNSLFNFDYRSEEDGAFFNTDNFPADYFEQGTNLTVVNDDNIDNSGNFNSKSTAVASINSDNDADINGSTNNNQFFKYYFSDPDSLNDTLNEPQKEDILPDYTADIELTEKGSNKAKSATNSIALGDPSNFIEISENTYSPQTKKDEELLNKTLNNTTKTQADISNSHIGNIKSAELPADFKTETRLASVNNHNIDDSEKIEHKSTEVAFINPDNDAGIKSATNTNPFFEYYFSGPEEFNNTLNESQKKESGSAVNYSYSSEEIGDQNLLAANNENEISDNNTNNKTSKWGPLAIAGTILTGVVAGATKLYNRFQDKQDGQGTIDPTGSFWDYSKGANLFINNSAKINFNDKSKQNITEKMIKSSLRKKFAGVDALNAILISSNENPENIDNAIKNLAKTADLVNRRTACVKIPIVSEERVKTKITSATMNVYVDNFVCTLTWDHKSPNEVNFSKPDGCPDIEEAKLENAKKYLLDYVRSVNNSDSLEDQINWLFDFLRDKEPNQLKNDEDNDEDKRKAVNLLEVYTREVKVDYDAQHLVFTIKGVSLTEEQSKTFRKFVSEICPASYAHRERSIVLDDSNNEDIAQSEPEHEYNYLMNQAAITAMLLGNEDSASNEALVNRIKGIKKKRYKKWLKKEIEEFLIKAGRNGIPGENNNVQPKKTQQQNEHNEHPKDMQQQNENNETKTQNGNGTPENNSQNGIIPDDENEKQDEEKNNFNTSMKIERDEKNAQRNKQKKDKKKKTNRQKRRKRNQALKEKQNNESTSFNSGNTDAQPEKKAANTENEDQSIQNETQQLSNGTLTQVGTSDNLKENIATGGTNEQITNKNNENQQSDETSHIQNETTPRKNQNNANQVQQTYQQDESPQQVTTPRAQKQSPKAPTPLFNCQNLEDKTENTVEEPVNVNQPVQRKNFQPAQLGEHQLAQQVGVQNEINETANNDDNPNQGTPLPQTPQNKNRGFWGTIQGFFTPSPTANVTVENVNIDDTLQGGQNNTGFSFDEWPLDENDNGVGDEEPIDEKINGSEEEKTKNPTSPYKKDGTTYSGIDPFD